MLRCPRGVAGGSSPRSPCGIGDYVMPEVAEQPTPSAERTAASGRPGWNVVATALEESFRDARELLRRWGPVKGTPYYNVLVMTVEDPLQFLADFAAAVAENPGYLNFVSHLFSAQRSFDFTDAGEFEARAREIALGWTGDLAGKRFHVRMRRRGFKGTLSTPKEERFLDEALLQALDAAGTPGRVGFEAPDAIVQIETVDGRAGLSLWSAADVRRYPFLGVD